MKHAPGDNVIAAWPDGRVELLGKVETTDKIEIASRLALGAKVYSMKPPPDVRDMILPLARLPRFEREVDRLSIEMRYSPQVIIPDPMLFGIMGLIEGIDDWSARDALELLIAIVRFVLHAVKLAHDGLDLLIAIATVAARAATSTLLELDAEPRASAPDPVAEPIPLELD